MLSRNYSKGPWHLKPLWNKYGRKKQMNMNRNALKRTFLRLLQDKVTSQPPMEWILLSMEETHSQLCLRLCVCVCVFVKPVLGDSYNSLLGDGELVLFEVLQHLCQIVLHVFDARCTSGEVLLRMVLLHSVLLLWMQRNRFLGHLTHGQYRFLGHPHMQVVALVGIVKASTRTLKNYTPIVRVYWQS